MSPDSPQRHSVRNRAGKNLRFFKIVFRLFRFFRFLGFNVRTVAGGTIDTRIRSRRKLYTRSSAVLRLLGALGQINTWDPLLPFPVHFFSLYSSVPSTTNLIASRV